MTYEPDHHIVELTLANWYKQTRKHCVVEKNDKIWRDARRLTVINVLKALYATREYLNNMEEDNVQTPLDD